MMSNIRFAVRWIEVAPKLVGFVHRHGPWKAPRSREEFEHLWYDFEEVLADLVGSYLKLLSRVDRILTYKEPTKEIIGTLPILYYNPMQDGRISSESLNIPPG